MFKVERKEKRQNLRRSFKLPNSGQKDKPNKKNLVKKMMSVGKKKSAKNNGKKSSKGKTQKNGRKEGGRKTGSKAKQKDIVLHESHGMKQQKKKGERKNAKRKKKVKKVYFVKRRMSFLCQEKILQMSTYRHKGS